MLAAIAAISLRWLLLRFVSPVPATAVAALWVVAPNHGSLLYWTTGTAITVALVLLLVGLRFVADGRAPVGGLLLAASVLTYEATAPVALVGIVVLPLLARRRDGWRAAIAAGAVLTPAVVWMLLSIPDVKQGLDRSAALGQLLPAHVGWGVFPRGWVATSLGLAACVVATVLLAEAVRRRRFGEDVALALAGVVVVVLGTLPFVRYFYAPLGAGDRVNVVAGVGTALLWVGLGHWVARHAPAAIVAAAAGVVVLAMSVATWQSTHAWADAVDEGEAVLASLRPVRAGDRIVLPRSTLRRNVAPFLDHSNIAGAVQLEAGTRDVEAFLSAPEP